MIRVALIGYGYWGSRLFETLVADPRFDVGIIIVENPGKLKVDKPLPPVSGDFDVALSDHSIQATVIASPAATHFDIGKRCLLSGKHVFIEKPLADTGGQAQELRNLAHERGLTIFVDYTFALLPAITAIKKILHDGELGTVRVARMVMTQTGRFNGIDVYRLLGSHMLAVLDQIHPIESLSLGRKDILVRNGLTETGAITFKSCETLATNIDPGLNGVMHLSLNDPTKRRQVILACTRGTIYCDMKEGGGMVSVSHNHKSSRIRSLESAKQAAKECFYDVTGLQNAFSQFYDSLQGIRNSNDNSAAAVSRALDDISPLAQHGRLFSNIDRIPLTPHHGKGMG